MDKKKARVIVRGQVQGVGYRYFALKTAQKTGISGCVKNMQDGSVELMAEGENGKIEEFIQTLRHKHPWAKIEALEVEWQAYDGEFERFEITY